jgi:hypothetical protein
VQVEDKPHKSVLRTCLYAASKGRREEVAGLIFAYLPLQPVCSDLGLFSPFFRQWWLVCRFAPLPSTFFPQRLDTINTFTMAEEKDTVHFVHCFFSCKQ